MNNKNHTELSLDGIQNQINYCDEIIELVDKIVPKIYKVRQQCLAQKEYINDVSRKLLTTGMDSTTGFEAGNVGKKKIVFADDSLGTTLVGNTWKDASFKPSTPSGAGVFNNTKLQREVIQSLFKYKHDVGTENHFTTDQIGVAADRTHGLNLLDVKTLLTGVNGLMKQSNSSPAVASEDLKQILLKNKEELIGSNNERFETSSVIPVDDSNLSISKVLISEKKNSYQTKLSKAVGTNLVIEYSDQATQPTSSNPEIQSSVNGVDNTIPEVLAANMAARLNQYLAIDDNKCEPASLFEKIQSKTDLDSKTQLNNAVGTGFEKDRSKSLAANSDTINTIVAGITLGTELADPWNARHKYVGFGLGD